jgi:hypothetical protein
MKPTSPKNTDNPDTNNNREHVCNTYMCNGRVADVFFGGKYNGLDMGVLGIALDSWCALSAQA